MWEPGTKLIRNHSPELGVGVVVDVDGRFLDVFFPDAMTRLRLTPDPASIQPIILGVGDLVKTPENEIDTILEIDGPTATLSMGTRVAMEALWPVLTPPSLLTSIQRGKLDEYDHVLNRIDGIRLLNFRRQGDMESLIGGRIELFAHQLDTASRAIKKDKVRWLLADEVGLGKTIVAHMITSAMIRMGRIESAVIVAPDTLTVQWLGELYRKFHQVFVHIDEERLDCVRTDYGEAVNPFDVHPLAVVSNELLANEPSLLFELQNIRPDLVVIDEAHRLLHDPVGEHLLALVEQTKHALLLTATPFQLGVDGFMRLVEALELEHNTLDSGVRLIKGVSAVTRHDIPELPIRQPHAHEIEQPGDLGADDPRTQWVLSRLETWKEDGHKALLFVEDAADAQILHETLTRLGHMELFMFHEEMSTKDRDIELSRFKISTSPALISSGAGSEGRNFQFCDVIVHFSLPADPTVLEQRIGRLDRIGREGDIPIHYFKYEGAPFAHTYETLGIFEDASIGASPAMMVLKDYFENPYRDESKLSVVVDDVKTAIKTHEAKWFFPESHDSEMADEVLDQLPEELDALVERFCVDAADCVGLSVVEKDGFSVYFFELGSDVIVETIPGLPIDARYLGTFDREEAVDNQALDFFSNGHELIEGLLVELEDSQRGRMGALKLSRAKVVNTGWKSLTFGHYLVAIRGDHGTFDVNLYALDEDARQISMDEDEVLESLEWSKNASRDDRKDAQRSLRACENLESLDHDDYAALILVKLVK